jgi:hypothetical protein
MKVQCRLRNMQQITCAVQSLWILCVIKIFICICICTVENRVLQLQAISVELRGTVLDTDGFYGVKDGTSLSSYLLSIRERWGCFITSNASVMTASHTKNTLTPMSLKVSIWYKMLLYTACPTSPYKFYWNYNKTYKHRSFQRTIWSLVKLYWK